MHGSLFNRRLPEVVRRFSQYAAVTSVAIEAKAVDQSSDEEYKFNDENRQHRDRNDHARGHHPIDTGSNIDAVERYEVSLHRPPPSGLWRGGARHASLARVLALCETEVLSERQARAVGLLAGKSGHDDIVDVTVVEGAIRRHDAIVTSNHTHTHKIADAARAKITIEQI